MSADKTCPTPGMLKAFCDAAGWEGTADDCAAADALLIAARDIWRGAAPQDDLPSDERMRQLEAAVDRATLAAKLSGRTYETREESLKAYEDARIREDELLGLIATYGEECRAQERERLIPRRSRQAGNSVE